MKNAKGTSLIEVLIVMVIIAMLAGLILPGVGRAREDAGQIRCRSNLRQLGRAITMYAQGYGSYTPCAYGAYADAERGSHLVHGGAGDGMAKMILQWHLIPRVYASGDGYNPGADPRDDVALEITYPAAPGAALPSGLGLLLSGGFLAQKGAGILNCPSRANRADTGSPSPFHAFDSRAADFYRDCWNRIREPALNAVFYTTGGRVAWSHDRLNFGWNDTSAYFNDSRRWAGGGSIAAAGGQMTVVGTSWAAPQVDCGYNNGRPQGCFLTGNYMIRPDSSPSYTWNSYRIGDMTDKGLLSDAVWGWMWNTAEREMLSPVAWNTPEALSRRHWKSNHDLSYNVLFGDGAVKTFADGGQILMDDVRKEQIRRRGRTPTNATYATWWKTYFDPIYALD